MNYQPKIHVMKKIYTLFIGLICFAGFEMNSNAQSLVVNGTLFLPQDSIEFTYESPSFVETDWIGIYHIDEEPGGPASTVWSYIPEASGTLYLQAPDEAGWYKAFLLCCDGYDTIDISAEFQVAIPSITASASVYTQGDSMVFTYVSPKFSDSDWIGIYPHGEKPDGDPESIDWDYIPDSAGTLTFHTDLDPGIYDAYLLCCDGYDSISACTFEVVSGNTAFVAPKSPVFEAGSPIELTFNDPNFTEDDWIGLYFEGDDPMLVTSVTYAYLSSQSGTITFPGTLSGGNYFAVMFCCGGSETIYAQSGVFTVQAGTSGTYVKTVASIYPEGAPILVNFRNPELQEKDWIGIYHKGESPGGPSSIDYQYITIDSGTVEFTTALTPGEYVVFMLCCDGYNIKAKYNFKVADASTPTLIASSLTYSETDSLVFYYNSPSFDPYDWIGIYNPGDVPGDVYSITWFYIPQASGTMVFRYPDNHELEPGEYWAGLFCCDGYDLYAQTTIIITEATGINRITRSGNVIVYPNPSGGIVSVRTDDGIGLQSITVYTLTGQVLYNERISTIASERTLNLEFLGSGMYIIKVGLTGDSPVTLKLVIQ
jgi:hypothetical protein